MKGFKDSTHMQSGHNFAKGGHVPRPHFAQAHPVSPAGANKDTVNGLTARTPDMAGNGAVKRSVPSTAVDEATGGKGELNSAYKAGGKVVHVHQHYHNGKRLPSARQIAKKRASAEAGLISSGTAGVKLGRNAISNGKGTPSERSKFAKGGRTIPHKADKMSGRHHIPHSKGGKIGPIKKGALHAEMGIPQGEKIGKKRLESAKHSGNPVEAKRANFALNMNRKATGGTIDKLATGGTIDKLATGGTIDKLNCGGAMYSRGGKAPSGRY